MSIKGFEMLREHMSYYDFNPDSVLLLGNVLYYLKQAEGEVAELESENKKLRKLVRDMSLPYKYGDCDCGLCPHTDKCWDSETLDFSPDGCVILQMVQELGIEVDE